MSDSMTFVQTADVQALLDHNVGLVELEGSTGKRIWIRADSIEAIWEYERV